MAVCINLRRRAFAYVKIFFLVLLCTTRNLLKNMQQCAIFSHWARNPLGIQVIDFRQWLVHQTGVALKSYDFHRETRAVCKSHEIKGLRPLISCDLHTARVSRWKSHFPHVQKPHRAAFLSRKTARYAPAHFRSVQIEKRKVSCL